MALSVTKVSGYPETEWAKSISSNSVVIFVEVDVVGRIHGYISYE